ncbi:MAG TPA: TonB-dependent receptor [Blastocatellia bacterium]|nr:TonB-dependent receptor [Blastocatellia bacterium]
MAQASVQDQSIAPVEPQTNQKLVITVLDENSVPVMSAQVILTRSESKSVLRGETDYAGRREFMALNSGVYFLKVEKAGFFAAKVDEIQVGKTETIDVILNHEQELRDSLNVDYSPPAIDLSKTSASQDLSTQEILNIPYSGQRDYRNVLGYIPGVLQDRNMQLHINGAASSQNLNQYDGFNISHPADGVLQLRASPDAFRSIEVKSSRYSAEYGKGSGGIVSLASRTGDDRNRFTITDFVPSFQFRKGIDVNSWTPRTTVSGPIIKQKAWFFDATDGEYNIDVIQGLPDGRDRTSSYRLNNVAKAQVNLNQTNILTGSYLINRYRSNYTGLSQLDPKDVTRELRQEAALYTLKDQSYFSNGMLMEFGVAFNQYNAREIPYGNASYQNFPTGRIGSYFRASEAEARRVQGILNLTLPPVQAHGRHEVKVGMDVDRINYFQFFDRRSIFIYRRDRSLTRQVDFTNAPAPVDTNNTELSGYAQDRWSLSDRWLLETGLRMDWDAILREVLLSPRMATTYLLSRDGETKLSLGAGIFYDPTNLNLISQPLTGTRTDQFFNPDGTSRGPAVPTVFTVNQPGLRPPRFMNWSLGVEQKLPSSIYLHVEFIERRGSGGLSFVNRGVNPLEGRYELASERLDRYDALQITMRRKLKDHYTVFVSYTRSAARSNAAFDPGLDNPIFGQQAAGPVPWDTPNNIISWGWLPLFWKFDLSYAFDWRDGFPFSTVNQDLQLIGLPNASRYPRYFSLNLHAERRFRFLGRNWALRAGFNNITDSKNPATVDNNIDSKGYYTFGSFQQRTFVGRLRFLGRK